MSKMTKKVASVALSVVFALSLVSVSPANAQTAAELQAQIAQLLSQINSLQGQLGQGTTAAPSTSYSFTRNLTVGSKGDDVSALQQVLIDEGYLKIDAPTGFFGNMTKAALAAMQKAAGISPAVGYFGPKTRAYLESIAVVPTPTQTTTPAPTGTTTPNPTSTVTPGPAAEGTLTVEANPSPADGGKIYEGDSKVALLGLKLKATGSDIKVERVKIDLGASTAIYTKILSKFYVMDGSTVLAEYPLTSSAVVKEGTNYFVTLTGFGFTVPVNTTKVLTIAADAYNTIDTADANAADRVIGIPANGVRGVDGLNINQFGPANAFTRTFNPEKTLATTASLTVSKNTSSPKVGNIVSNTVGDVNDATMLVLDLRSENDRVKVTRVIANVTQTGSSTLATARTLYLYDGSTLIGSATVASTTAFTTTADFGSNLEFFVEKDATKSLTIKADFRGAAAGAATTSVTVTGANITAENSRGDTVVPSGSAAGDAQNIASVLPIFAASPQTSITFVPGTQGVSTSSINGSFSFSVKAGGNDVFVSDASTTAAIQAFLSNALTTVSTNATVKSVTLSSEFQNVAANTFKLSKDQTGTVTVNFSLRRDQSDGTGFYDFRMASFKWGSAQAAPQAQTTTFDTNVWKTSQANMQ